MADETKPAVKTADTPAAEEPRTLDVKRCDVCGHNAVDDQCGHCGFGLTGKR